MEKRLEFPEQGAHCGLARQVPGNDEITLARQNLTSETRSVRLLKVGEQVRHVISELLMRQHVHDEVLSAHTVSVTEVRMSPDLRHASVFIKALLGEDEELVLKALRTNTAYFQKEVAGKLKLKYAAKVRFLADESFDVASRIDGLLADPRVARDLAQGKPTETDTDTDAD